jgi:integrase
VPSLRFTDANVRNLKPPRADGRRQVKYFDTLQRGLALVLVVSYGGTKAWSVTTYRNGHAKAHKLGTYPHMSLKEARQQAQSYFHDAAPFEAKAATGSFREVAEDWLRQKVEGRFRTAREVRRHLEFYVYPKWGRLPFVDIRRKDVAELMDIIADHHGKAMADAVLTTLRSLMTWFQTRDHYYVSPIIRGMQRSEAKARDRILSDDEIRLVWKAAESQGQFGALVKVLLLTGSRRQKIASLKWDDLDHHGTWTVAVAEREKGTIGKVRLPAAVMQIINALPRRADYVFANRQGQAFNDFSSAKRQFDKRVGSAVAPWTLHDLRRSARSLMSRAGVSSEHAERTLGHAIGGVEGIYNRHDFADEKAAALQKLADVIAVIVEAKPARVRARL